MPKRVAFRHLEAFLAVARDLNVSRVAQQMNIAQPALSQQIHLLEDRIGVALFDRNARPLELTEAGHYFRSEVKSLVQRFDAAVEETREIARGRKGWFGIGFTRSAMYSFLPPIVRRFTTDHPSVELRLFEMLTEEQPEALRSGSIHLGLARDPGDAPGLAQEVLLTESLTVALSRHHPMAKRPRLRLADLADESFVLFPKHPTARFPSRVLRLCQEAGFSPRVVQETFEIQTALGLVAAGLGITLVTAGVAEHGRADLVFTPLDDAEHALTTLLVALYRPGPKPPLLEAALVLMRSPSREIGVSR